MIVHLVRHGESEWNAARRIQGRTAHVPLTDVGRAQAREAAGMLTDVRTIRTSDLLRARETAEIIAAVHGVTPILEPALRERSFGDLEGAPVHEVYGGVLDLHDPDVRPPGGESLRDVYERLLPLREVIRDGDVLVTHGNALRVALLVFAGRPVADVSRESPPNGHVVRVPVHEPMRHSSQT